MRVGGLKRWLEPDHYGSVIVATLSVTETVTWRIVYYGFPVFLRPMEQDLGASRVAVTGAFSLGLGVSALGANGARAIGPVGASLLWIGFGSYPAVFGVLAAPWSWRRPRC